MKYILSIIMIVTLLGCGGSDSVNEETLIESSLTDNNVAQETTEQTTEEPTNDTNLTHEKIVTIYVHGYSPSGANKVAIYGENNYADESATQSIIEITGYPTTETYNEENDTNLLAITSYYGNVAPSYYTPKDRRDIIASELGIPRYALIMAKFAKEMLESSGADKVQFISVSMGSLVTRYLIEKNLEGLASEKKIKKWLSLEGVIAGNIAASADNLFNVVNSIEEQSIDVDHMHYSWINDNLGSLRTATSSYYQDIQLGFESSTNDADNEGALSFWLRLNDNFQPNDGYQIVKDTYFSTYLENTLHQNQQPTHTFFHETHTSLADNKAAWAYAATFLSSQKRVKITLLNASIKDLHEDNLPLNISLLPAEIVFESSVYSPAAMQKWNIQKAIDDRRMRGGNLPLYDYHDANQALSLNQTLFDSYVLDEETTLTLNIAPIELDFEPNYGVREYTGHGDNEGLGTHTMQVPLQNGTLSIQSTQWSGQIKVEVF